MIYQGNETYEFRNGMKLNFDELKWILEELNEEYENNMEIRNLLDIIFKDIVDISYNDGYNRGYDEAKEIFEEKGYCEEE